MHKPVNNAIDMLLRINVSDERQRYPHVRHGTCFLVSGKGNISKALVYQLNGGPGSINKTKIKKKKRKGWE